jgi:hypothetical protein
VLVISETDDLLPARFHDLGPTAAEDRIYRAPL